MCKSQNSADINLLTAAVKDIAIISCSSLGEISTIGKLILLWLERPEAYRDPETISSVLNGIIYTAQNTIDNITQDAESVGYYYIDQDAQRHQRAAEEYRNAIMSEKQNQE
ncbi:hypothetical protein R3P88_002004 [Salmonella enterica]|uniref:hypothetical protein n=1 Tax=Salmonella enterica TaxID=28901 RepID=UPI000DECC710|nr:hypothetical protein [Salmonella enterica]ECC9262058.1 hypothetical protein [Salmonella enterica subsp. diarizonae]ECW9808040.1 hypothetical protein [Salmonella enterica subsp. enterica serovar Poona]AXD08080.1 hypothetical protein CHE29_03225 [Salmonella enterica]EAQ6246905.1 hypothetical protein [Salmonella enterica]EAU6879138.1 hypothetical protein [Salmonella enterica]